MKLLAYDKPLRTRNKEYTAQIIYNKSKITKGTMFYHLIIALLTDENGDQRVEAFDITGKLHAGGEPHDLDLVNY